MISIKCHVMEFPRPRPLVTGTIVKYFAFIATLASIFAYPHGSYSGMDDLPKKIDRQQLGQTFQKLIGQAHREAEAGRHQESEDHYTQALELLRQLFPRDAYPRGHFAIASCLFDLGNVVLAQGKFPQAEADYRASLVAVEKRV